ncbi:MULTISPECIES: hypothetical protein [Pseudomonadaceae]|uniref:hypothetical protein n=1 Tax=Pseudomonadaceae TaxID=135621 RepID=UPI0015E39976|nr:MULTISPECIES: hypothetical protein [Pseudomonadaceae]MBA1280469.1 hypothetical protein [Stutzerimonas stutzeri]MBH8610681.1 hypothetical protein [Pseudomonas mohnii]
MGATVTTGKLAAAFRADNGKTYYVLFEQTYEKNTFPHTPRWSCRAIGALPHVMSIVFWSAAGCEGGSTQAANGRDISPETYIHGWLQELANPVDFQDQEILLETGKGWSVPVPADELQSTCELLKSLGRQDISGALEQGESVRLSLYADVDLISAVFDSRRSGPWRVIAASSAPLYGTRNAALGYNPVKAKAYELPTTRFYKISDKTSAVLIQREDNQWRCEGWGYNYVNDYVTNLWEAELREPGSYRTKIKALRAAINNAPYVPKEGVKVIVDTAVPVESYKTCSIQDAAGELSYTTTGSEMVFTMADDYDTLYRLTALPHECSTWVFNEGCPVEQMNLLAG